MEYVCYCSKVTEADIREAIDAGAESLAAVIQATGAMKSRNCRVNNPKGVCCYADLAAVYAKYAQKGSTEHIACCSTLNHPVPGDDMI